MAVNTTVQPPYSLDFFQEIVNVHWNTRAAIFASFVVDQVNTVKGVLGNVDTGVAQTDPPPFPIPIHNLLPSFVTREEVTCTTTAVDSLFNPVPGPTMAASPSSFSFGEYQVSVAGIFGTPTGNILMKNGVPVPPGDIIETLQIPWLVVGHEFTDVGDYTVPCIFPSDASHWCREHSGYGDPLDPFNAKLIDDGVITISSNPFMVDGKAYKAVGIRAIAINTGKIYCVPV